MGCRSGVVALVGSLRVVACGVGLVSLLARLGWSDDLEDWPLGVAADFLFCASEDECRSGRAHGVPAVA